MAAGQDMDKKLQRQFQVIKELVRQRNYDAAIQVLDKMGNDAGRYAEFSFCVRIYTIGWEIPIGRLKRYIRDCCWIPCIIPITIIFRGVLFREGGLCECPAKL